MVTNDVRWRLAEQQRNRLLFSTYFVVKEIERYLATEEDFRRSLAICRDNGLLRVYLETFRDGVYADAALLSRARDRFRNAGLDVWGVVCTTHYGQPSTALTAYPCLTAEQTQQELAAMFRFTAEIFDNILIDEYIWSHCRCDSCQRAKGARSWKQYRCEQMQEVCREHVIDAARSVNPNARLLYKFPSPFEVFTQQGQHIDLIRTQFDGIWSGTEVGTFFDSPQDPRTSQGGFRSFWLTRWMQEAGRGSCGGAWIMPLEDHGHFRDTAFQTVLATPPEIILHPFGGMTEPYRWVFPGGGGEYPDFMEDIPSCFELMEIIRAHPHRGLAAICPVDAEPWRFGEAYDANVFDVVGQLGIPLLPQVDAPSDAEGFFLSLHARSLPDYAALIAQLQTDARPLLLTDGLATTLAHEFTARNNVQVIAASATTPFLFAYDERRAPYGKLQEQAVVPSESAWDALISEKGWDSSLGYTGNPEVNERLLNMPQDALDELRNRLLRPFGLDLRMPARVALAILGHKFLVIHNFRDEPVSVRVRSDDAATYHIHLCLPTSSTAVMGSGTGHQCVEIPPHTLVCLRAGR